MLLDKRGSGVLLHISSLPSPYGIGTFGKEAYRFIDFLSKAKQTYWQILPLTHPSIGNSPYSSYSSYAGNPYFIDFDLLKEEGLLNKNDYNKYDWTINDEKVNYDYLNKYHHKILKIAVNNFIKKNKFKDFNKFKNDNAFWLNDYALFMAIQKKYKKEWYKWPIGLKNRNKNIINDFINSHKELIIYYEIIQYLFYKQWNSLRKYAKEKNIKIIGDVPIYVALNSVDVWSEPKLFKLEKDGKPSFVSGCPPDPFSSYGQNWMNPLYNWNYHKKHNYSWWIKRIDYLCHIYDALRIDHFIGFKTYYAIPINKAPKYGHWEKGPGISFFNELKRKGTYNLIAEDLGNLTKGVIKMLKDTKYPGMKVIQFAFDYKDNKPNNYRPHLYDKNCIAYSGTHDSNTLCGFLNNININDIKLIKEYFGISNNEDLCYEILKGLWRSSANTVIIQAQDILKLDDKARMNIPSTKKGNWEWRIKKNSLNNKIATQLARYMELYNR